MRILVVNPNTTASMTAKIAAGARHVAASGTTIVACNPAQGPVSIEGHYDQAVAVPHLLDTIKRSEAEPFDGIVIACFDDPIIDACREIASGPVIGICQAAMLSASMIASSFSVVTTLPRAVPIIETLARHYGMDIYCRRVRSAEIPVLALEQPDGVAYDKVRHALQQAIDEDQCEALILGCAGMTDLAERFSVELGLPVIDGVSAAVKLIEALVGGGLNTSRRCGYARPREK